MTSLSSDLMIAAQLARGVCPTPDQELSVRMTEAFVAESADHLDSLPDAPPADGPESALLAFVRTDLTHLRETMTLASRAMRTMPDSEMLSAIIRASGGAAQAPSGACLRPRLTAELAVRGAIGNLRANADMILTGAAHDDSPSAF